MELRGFGWFVCRMWRVDKFTVDVGSKRASWKWCTPPRLPTLWMSAVQCVHVYGACHKQPIPPLFHVLFRSLMQIVFWRPIDVQFIVLLIFTLILLLHCVVCIHTAPVGSANLQNFDGELKRRFRQSKKKFSWMLFAIATGLFPQIVYIFAHSWPSSRAHICGALRRCV